MHPLTSQVSATVLTFESNKDPWSFYKYPITVYKNCQFISGKFGMIIKQNFETLYTSSDTLFSLTWGRKFSDTAVARAVPETHLGRY